MGYKYKCFEPQLQPLGIPASIWLHSCASHSQTGASQSRQNTNSFIISSLTVQTSGSGISSLLAVGTTFTGSGNLYYQWELSPGSGNALCILFPTVSSSKRRII
nr:hypothetical protein [Tanacetum cinerariifolium]